jgi:hypothetical protein
MGFAGVKAGPHPPDYERDTHWTNPPCSGVAIVICPPSLLTSVQVLTLGGPR